VPSPVRGFSMLAHPKQKTARTLRPKKGSPGAQGEAREAAAAAAAAKAVVGDRSPCVCPLRPPTRAR